MLVESEYIYLLLSQKAAHLKKTSRYRLMPSDVNRIRELSPNTYQNSATTFLARSCMAKVPVFSSPISAKVPMCFLQNDNADLAIGCVVQPLLEFCEEYIR